MAENKFGIEARDDYRPGLIAAPYPDTMQIASEDTESGYVIINVADFDKATMKKYAPKKGE